MFLVYFVKCVICYLYVRIIGIVGFILCDVFFYVNDYYYYFKENDMICYNFIIWRFKLNKVKLRNFGGGWYLI